MEDVKNFINIHYDLGDQIIVLFRSLGLVQEMTFELLFRLEEDGSVMYRKRRWVREKTVGTLGEFKRLKPQNTTSNVIEIVDWYK